MNRSGNIILLFLVLVVLLIPIMLNAQAELVFRDTAIVSGSHVLLNDIAHIASENSELTEKLKAVKISTIPPVGIPLSVDRRIVDYKLQQQRIKGVSFSGEEMTIVFADTIVIKGAEITQKVEEFLNEKLSAVNSRFEIQFSKIPPDVVAPRSEISLEIIQKKFGRMKGAFLVNIGVYTGGKLFRNVPVSVKVRTFEPVVTAVRPLSQGILISPEDVKLSMEETTNYNYDLVSNINLISGKRTRVSISQGKPVLLKNIEDPPVVRKGDKVQIQVKRGGISISCSGIAVEEGRMGELIRVRREDGKVVYRAKVTGTASVEID